MEHRHWPHFDQNHMKDYLKDHPALRLMETLAQRDAAIAERDTAMAEKKTAFAERDAALLQRDVAYADRNTAWMERDTALAALTMLRANKDNNNEAAAKLMHMVNINVNPFVEPVMALPPSESMPGGPAGGKKQQGKKTQEGAKKRKRPAKEKGQRRRGPKSAQKMEMQQQLPSEAMFKADGTQEEVPPTSFSEVVPYDLMLSTPIPYCSCSGGNQQCYRWGNGGWQSACCTNVLSLYPLPMSPTKRGARVPGRKMSGGAFKKILEKLAAEGVDVTMPIDLRNHWAKHGTNRYVTIK